MKTMKNVSMKFFLSVCLLTMTASAFAQFANPNSTNASSTVLSTAGAVDTDEWERLFVSYNPMKFIYDDEDDDAADFTGFSIGFVKSYSISQAYPLFLESGASLLYATHTDDENEDFEYKITAVSLNIPLNLVYKFSLPNSNLKILPYVGVNFRGNIIGQAKISFTGDEDDYPSYDEDDFEDETYSFFDKDDVDKDSVWNRFQMGWQIGVGLTTNQLYVGVGFGKDMSELAKDVKTSNTSITIGYTF